MQTQTITPATNTLQFYIGDNYEERKENLQCIKDVMSEILLQGLNDEMLLTEKIKIHLQEILNVADEQLNTLTEEENEEEQFEGGEFFEALEMCKTLTTDQLLQLGIKISRNTEKEFRAEWLGAIWTTIEERVQN